MVQYKDFFFLASNVQTYIFILKLKQINNTSRIKMKWTEKKLDQTEEKTEALAELPSFQ